MTILNEYFETNSSLIFLAIIFGMLALMMLCAVICSIKEDGWNSITLIYIILFIFCAIICSSLSFTAIDSSAYYIECTFNEGATFTVEDMQKYKLKEQREEIYIYEVLPEKE